jgi:hypothetical protein
MPQSDLERIIALLEAASSQTRSDIFTRLRRVHKIHPLETEWATTAEFILEAIARSQDITKRGVRGVIAELAFSEFIVKALGQQWIERKLTGDLPYDSLIEDEIGQIKIQTKNQRLVKGTALYASASLVARCPDAAGWFVAETQKTRSGKKRRRKQSAGDILGTNVDLDAQSSRPYRFGEFDILSVCLHPSSGDWTRFMFTPAHTLLARKADANLMETLQPVPDKSCFAWTDNLLTCIGWIRNPESCPAPQEYISVDSQVKKVSRQQKSSANKKSGKI